MIAQSTNPYAPETICRETPREYGVFNRVSDIWRGYWAQRLLWEIGGHVAFGPPRVSKVRGKIKLVYDAGKSHSFGCKIYRCISKWKKHSHSKHWASVMIA